MRCKVCEYRLWNLNSRNCPECGTPFRPSDYQFIPNSVQFCCPHCDQAYYGQDLKGHLVPPQFDCVQCGQHVHMDQMVLRPGKNLREEQTELDYNPWLERARRGRFKGWFAMIGRSMVGPVRLINATPPESSVRQAFWFAFIVLLITLLTGILSIVLFYGLLPFVLFARMGAAMGGAGAPPGPPPIAFLGGLCGCSGAVLLIGIIGYIVYLLIWGAVTHLIVGAGRQREQGIGRTYQALCYSCGPFILGAVPCLGPYVLQMPGFVWWVVSAIFMVQAGHKIHGGRATLAVLAFPVFSILAMIGLYAAVLILVFTFAQTRATANWGVTAVNSPATALTMHAQQNNGRGPDHAIELIGPNIFMGADFIDPTSNSTELTIPVGNTTLAAYNRMSFQQRRTTARAVVNAVPANVVAHRLGDFVFVHHGINFNNADPSLWSVITWPDPDVNPAGPADATVDVATVDGGFQSFPVSELSAELKAQNELRAKNGLPPIPSPDTVTHDQPATAPVQNQ